MSVQRPWSGFRVLRQALKAFQGGLLWKTAPHHYLVRRQPVFFYPWVPVDGGLQPVWLSSQPHYWFKQAEDAALWLLFCRVCYSLGGRICCWPAQQELDWRQTYPRWLGLRIWTSKAVRQGENGRLGERRNAQGLGWSAGSRQTSLLATRIRQKQ